MVDRVHCFGLHFMNRLLIDPGEYNYRNMRGWGRRIRGGLAKLKVLYVPINIGNTHWIFIRVDVLQKRAELYCSFAMKNHENLKYLTVMMKYIYNELHKDTLDSRRPSYQAWRRG